MIIYDAIVKDKEGIYYWAKNDGTTIPMLRADLYENFLFREANTILTESALSIYNNVLYIIKNNKETETDLTVLLYRQMNGNIVIVGHSPISTPTQHMQHNREHDVYLREDNGLFKQMLFPSEFTKKLQAEGENVTLAAVKKRCIYPNDTITKKGGAENIKGVEKVGYQWFIPSDAPMFGRFRKYNGTAEPIADINLGPDEDEYVVIGRTFTPALSVKDIELMKKFYGCVRTGKQGFHQPYLTLLSEFMENFLALETREDENGRILSDISALRKIMEDAPLQQRVKITAKDKKHLVELFEKHFTYEMPTLKEKHTFSSKEIDYFRIKYSDILDLE